MKQRVVEISTGKVPEIRESYSADTIAAQKRIRGPFQFEGRLYVSVGWIQAGEECYRVVPKDQCNDDAVWYGEEITWSVTLTETEQQWATSWAAHRRSQPEGFYHRMLVKRGKSDWVMLGPSILFVLRDDEALVETKQLALL